MVRPLDTAPAKRLPLSSAAVSRTSAARGEGAAAAIGGAGGGAEGLPLHVGGGAAASNSGVSAGGERDPEAALESTHSHWSWSGEFEIESVGDQVVKTRRTRLDMGASSLSGRNPTVATAHKSALVKVLPPGSTVAEGFGPASVSAAGGRNAARGPRKASDVSVSVEQLLIEVEVVNDGGAVTSVILSQYRGSTPKFRIQNECTTDSVMLYQEGTGVDLALSLAGEPLPTCSSLQTRND